MDRLTTEAERAIDLLSILPVDMLNLPIIFVGCVICYRLERKVMPSHKSCKKRMKTSEAERLRNRAMRSSLRSAVKEVRAETSKEEAANKLQTAIRLLDRAASRGLLHRKTVDRSKSRLTKLVNNLG